MSLSILSHQWFVSKLRLDGNVKGCHFWLGYKRIVISFSRWLLPSRSVSWMKWSYWRESLAKELSTASSQLRGGNRCLVILALKALRSANNYISEFGSISFTSWAFRWEIPGPVDMMVQPCKISSNKRPQRPVPGFLTHRSYEMINVHCSKPVNFGAICYTAIGNLTYASPRE